VEWNGMQKSRVSIITLLAVAYVADAGPAHAYIDPATGSILLQGIVGGAATFLVVIRLYGARAKKRILAILGRTPAKDDHNTPAAE
jgi:hypothetical protein